MGGDALKYSELLYFLPNKLLLPLIFRAITKTYTDPLHEEELHLHELTIVL